MPFPWLGAAIGAAGSVISGLLNKDDGKVETTVDYRAMAKAARAAGFNPLTALRNGGSAGFQVTHGPAMSAFAGIGPAVSTIGNALMAYDPNADVRAALENRLMEAQIGKLNSETARMRSFDVPSAAGATLVTNANGTKPVQPELGTKENPAPAYQYVYVENEDGTRRVQAVPNINFVPDDMSGLGVLPGAAVAIPPQPGAANWVNGGWHTPQAPLPGVGPIPNNKPRGTPPHQPLQIPNFGPLLDDVKTFDWNPPGPAW